MRKLDQRCDLRGVRNDRVVAQRPVIAATFAGFRRPNKRPPQNHQNIEAENHPCELGKSPHSLDYSVGNLLVVRRRLLQLCVRDQVVLDPERSVLVGQKGFDLHPGCRFFSGISERREWGEVLQFPFSRVVVQVASKPRGLFSED